MDVLALSNLLSAVSQDEEVDHGRNDVETSRLKPASFGVSSFINNERQQEKMTDSDDIGSPATYNYPTDDRPEPSYQIYFKQEVGTEDIFLGTDKSPGSFDCSHMVIKIHFPNASMDDLNLDVKSNTMLVESKNEYVLHVYKKAFGQTTQD